jgi:D-tyrosyl-tRNA(Tyr) deacylase
VRVVLQRVKNASVTVDGSTISEIGQGLLLLVGVGEGDTEEQTEWLASKVVNLRVFADDEGKMNRSVKEIEGEVLAVSQFTLLGDARKGNRPSFVRAAPPKDAEDLFDLFCRMLEEAGISVKKGSFGAMMDIDLVNEGPVTLILER